MRHRWWREPLNYELRQEIAGFCQKLKSFRGHNEYLSFRIMNTTSRVTEERPIQNGESKLTQSCKKSDNGLYHRILFGADFTPGSNRVFKHALQLAKQNNAELLILHAYDLPKTAGFIPADCYEGWLSDYRAHASNKAKTLVDQARKEGVRSHIVLCEGFPENTIARAVGKTKIDLVVIGTHGRHGLSRLLSPSVAARIIPNTNCPVLTVRRNDTPGL
jgi:universal stress protein A